MRIRDIPENTSYYTVPDAFMKDVDDKLWLDAVYECSEQPSSLRCIEVIRTPDDRFHIQQNALEDHNLRTMYSRTYHYVPCFEAGRSRTKKEEEPVLHAKDPGFRFL
jgi:hypothetical protein